MVKFTNASIVHRKEITRIPRHHDSLTAFDLCLIIPASDTRLATPQLNPTLVRYHDLTKNLDTSLRDNQGLCGENVHSSPSCRCPQCSLLAPVYPPAKMTLVSNDPAWWPMINSFRLSSYFTFASSTALIYDWVLTFGEEVELIWRQRWSFVTLLYLIIRYVGIPYYIINIMMASSGTDAE